MILSPQINFENFMSPKITESRAVSRSSLSKQDSHEKVCKRAISVGPSVSEIAVIIASEFICHFYGAIRLIGSVSGNQYGTDVPLLTINSWLLRTLV